MSSIAEILAKRPNTDGLDLGPVEVTKVWERKTLNGQYGPFKVEDCVVKDNSGQELTLNFMDCAPLADLGIREDCWLNIAPGTNKKGQVVGCKRVQKISGDKTYDKLQISGHAILTIESPDGTQTTLDQGLWRNKDGEEGKPMEGAPAKTVQGLKDQGKLRPASALRPPEAQRPMPGEIVALGLVGEPPVSRSEKAMNEMVRTADLFARVAGYDCPQGAGVSVLAKAIIEQPELERFLTSCLNSVYIQAHKT